METFGTVLILLGIILALALGVLIMMGVIPLDSYMEGYQEKRARDKRAREQQPHASLGQPRGGQSTSSQDTRPGS
jgi:hypothetical protein